MRTVLTVRIRRRSGFALVRRSLVALSAVVPTPQTLR
jgi:hypothetical protein